MTTSSSQPWPRLTSETDIDPELERIAWLVDRVMPDQIVQPARLYGIARSGDPMVLAEGEAHRILRRTRPPRGLRALALAGTGWVGSLDPDLPPSRQAGRRRCRHVAVVDDTHEIITLLRVADDEPALLRCDLGAIPDALHACWARRPDARGTDTDTAA